MARPKRFELLTPRFVVWRSNPLGHDSFDNHPDDPLIGCSNGQLMRTLAGLTGPRLLEILQETWRERPSFRSEALADRGA